MDHTTYARIDTDGRCAEFITWNPAGLYPVELKWLPVPAALVPFVGSKYRAEGEQILPPSLDSLREQVKALATERRWQVETGGITLADGTRILTATDDQARIDTALSNMERYAIKSVDFKSAAGFVTLSYDQLKAIGAAVVAHVQGCFSAEMKHHAAIDALTDVLAIAGYDCSAGWPGQAEPASAESAA